MGSGKKSRAWWASLPPKVRAGLRRQQSIANRRRSQPNADEFAHHHRDDVACPACGTDSNVGCIAGPPREPFNG